MFTFFHNQDDLPPGVIAQYQALIPKYASIAKARERALQSLSYLVGTGKNHFTQINWLNFQIYLGSMTLAEEISAEALDVLKTFIPQKAKFPEAPYILEFIDSLKAEDLATCSRRLNDLRVKAKTARKTTLTDCLEIITNQLPLPAPAPRLTLDVPSDPLNRPSEPPVPAAAGAGSALIVTTTPSASPFLSSASHAAELAAIHKVMIKLQTSVDEAETACLQLEEEIPVLTEELAHTRQQLAELQARVAQLPEPADEPIAPATQELTHLNTGSDLTLAGDPATPANTPAALSIRTETAANGAMEVITTAAIVEACTPTNFAAFSPKSSEQFRASCETIALNLDDTLKGLLRKRQCLMAEKAALLEQFSALQCEFAKLPPYLHSPRPGALQTPRKSSLLAPHSAAPQVKGEVEAMPPGMA